MKECKRIMKWVAAASILFVSIAATRTGALAVEDANWQNVLQYFQDTFRSAGDNLREFSSKLDHQSKEFARDLARIEKNKGQLMLMWGDGFDPNELRILMQGLTALRAEVEDRFKWFADAEHTLEIFADKIAELRAELKSQSSEPSAVVFKEALNRDLADISSLESQLLTIHSTMERTREACNFFLSRLDGAEQSTQRKTETYWKIFYLKNLPGLFSEETRKDLKDGTRRWMTEGALWWDMVRSPEEMLKIRELFLKISASVLLFALAGWMIIRRLKGCRLPPASALLPCILLFLWASITWFGAMAPFSVSFLVLTFGEQVLSLALIYVCFIFGGKSAGPGKFSFKAVFPLWVLHILSMEIRVLNLSYGAALIAWISLLAVCSLYMHWKRPDLAGRWERGLYMAAAYLPSILVVIAACGYLPLTFLAISIIQYGWLSIYLCVCLQRSLSAFTRETAEESQFLAGILASLGFPVVVLAFAYLNIWLLSLRLGGAAVLDRILSAELTWDAYRVNLKIFSLIILGFYFTRALALLVESLALRAAHLDAAITEVIQKTSKYLFWGLFATGVLSLLGFSLMSLTVVAGGLSVGIGFGLQQIVNNFFSGMILLMGRSIQPGDTIQIGDTLGDVRRVTIRNTVVQTRDNATFFVPNSELISNKLINWSHRDRRVRLTIAVGVAYGSNTEKVRVLLLQAARSVPGVLDVPVPDVVFSNFGASTLDFQIRFWINDVDNDTQLLSQVRYKIDRLFRENEIEIAFPQSTLHIQSAPALEKLLRRNN
jgi:potassium-dependent mechanosensitive channel